MEKYSAKYNKKKNCKKLPIYSNIIEDVKMVVGCIIVICLRSYK